MDTGIPNLVSTSSIAGAKAWYHCTSTYGIFVNLPYEISPPYAVQPYQIAQRRTAEAAAHIILQSKRSLLEAIHVPSVCTESFAITAYDARKNPIVIHTNSMYTSLLFLACDRSHQFWNLPIYL